jgi:hypothetical protein
MSSNNISLTASSKSDMEDHCSHHGNGKDHGYKTASMVGVASILKRDSRRHVRVVTITGCSKQDRCLVEIGSTNDVVSSGNPLVVVTKESIPRTTSMARGVGGSEHEVIQRLASPTRRTISPSCSARTFTLDPSCSYTIDDQSQKATVSNGPRRYSLRRQAQPSGRRPLRVRFANPMVLSPVKRTVNPFWSLMEYEEDLSVTTETTTTIPATTKSLTTKVVNSSISSQTPSSSTIEKLLQMADGLVLEQLPDATAHDDRHHILEQLQNLAQKMRETHAGYQKIQPREFETELMAQSLHEGQAIEALQRDHQPEVADVTVECATLKRDVPNTQTRPAAGDKDNPTGIDTVLRCTGKAM